MGTKTKSSRFELDKDERKEAKRIWIFALITILSISLALMFEYMFGDYLQGLPIAIQAIIFGSVLILLICLSMQSAKK